MRIMIISVKVFFYPIYPMVHVKVQVCHSEIQFVQILRFRLKKQKHILLHRLPCISLDLCVAP